MAEAQSTIALNIGSQRIAMAVFESTKSGALVLKAFDSESILADPATESSRALQIKTAIAELVGRAKVKGKVRYAISGQSVFIRFVKLPPLDDDNIEQLVTFEAQQHVPFPLEEVVWDYEVLDAGGDKEVMIVAIKGDALEEVNEGVNETGLTTAEVDVAPMALYNALRAAYPDLQEPTLLIDIGARTSDLLYVEGNRFFTRSAAMGGGAVTAAISKEFEVAFAEAEAHKTQNGLIALGGGHTDQLDEGTAALAMAIRNAMTRLATEIPRTTNYYRSQHNGNAPKRVLLAGGGANLPYVKEFFEEKLRMPVEFFNPLSAIQVGSGVDTDALSKEAHTLGELIGLGLRAAGKSKLNIDLVPAKVGQLRAAEKRRPFLIGAAAAFLVGLGVWAAMQAGAAGKAQEKVAEVEQQREHLSGPAGRIRSEVNREDKLRSIAKPYVEAENDRTFWFEALQEFKASFADEAIWIVDFSPVANFNPSAEKGGEGKDVVKGEFANAGYGTSQLQSIKVEAPQPTGRRGRNAPPPAPAAPAANAVRIKGFWLENPSNQNIVYNLLRKLKENAASGGSHYKFTTTNQDGEEVELEEGVLAPKVEADPEPEEYAAAFELMIPLSREVPIK